jgi:hypothetical protein
MMRREKNHSIKGGRRFIIGNGGQTALALTSLLYHVVTSPPPNCHSRAFRVTMFKRHYLMVIRMFKFEDASCISRRRWVEAGDFSRLILLSVVSVATIIETSLGKLGDDTLIW